MKLIWLDLETTGLEPEHDRILEIAVSEATLDKPFDARPIYHEVFALRPGTILDGFVQDMHTKNGLLAECHARYEEVKDFYPFAAYSVAREVLRDLIPLTESRSDTPVLAGSSIHFDHAFLKSLIPVIGHRFSHRHYDVSAIKLFCQSIGMPPLPKAEAHRAQEDVLESIEHAKKCAWWLKGSLR